MAIKRIFSAGGIVLRPARQDKEKWEVLVTQHSKHHGWDFPKGHIEVGESSEAAALREVEEETGVRAEVIERVGETKYFYWEAGPNSAKASSGKEKIFKTVIYFLMKYKEDGEATTAFEVSDKVWLPVSEVEEKLTFKDTRELWEKARERIGQLTTDN